MNGEPWVLLGIVALIVGAMPWRRPHPNHEFMLKMLQLLQDEETGQESQGRLGAPLGSN